MVKFRSSRKDGHRKYRSASQSFTNGVQTRIEAGKPNDKYEKEADRVAEKVTKGPSQISHQGFTGESPVQRQFIQRQEERKEVVQSRFIQLQGQQEEDKLQEQTEKKEPVQSSYLQAESEKKEPVQSSYLQTEPEKKEPPQAKFIQNQEEKKEEPVQTSDKEEMPQSNFIQRFAEGEGVHQDKSDNNLVLNKKPSHGTNDDTVSGFDFEGLLEKTKAGGKPLDDAMLKLMQSKLGHNFSSVRIHTGPDAERLTKYMRAQAFTVGNHIFFNEGKFQNDTVVGIKLLAHELTHVIQQGK